MSRATIRLYTVDPDAFVERHGPALRERGVREVTIAQELAMRVPVVCLSLEAGQLNQIVAFLQTLRADLLGYNVESPV